MSRYTDLSGCFSGLLYSWKLFFTMEDQHRHHFLVLRAMMSWSVVFSLYIALCCAWGWCCLLGCESVQCSYSSSVVDCLGLAFYLCSDWKWAGCSYIQWPVLRLLPVLSRVAEARIPLASVSKSCNGAKTPHLVQSRNAVAAMPKCCLPCDGKGWASTITLRCQARFSSSAFNWVASSIHNAVQEQNKVHKTAGFQRTVFLWLCLRDQWTTEPRETLLQHCHPLLS